MGEIMRGRFQGVIAGPYHRWLDGQHLGPYSPRYVPISTLKFMREHPQLSLGLAAYRGPFFGIDYDVTGGTPETRAFIRHVFLDTNLLDRAIETILNALDFGFQPHEVLWALKDVTFDPDSDGPAAPITMPMAAVIAECNDIDPQRVLPVVDDRDRLIGYRVDGWSVLDVIPIEKAIHAVHAMEHRQWRGRSLLKRAYKPWWWAEFICLFMSRWYERKSDPPYHGSAPADPRPDPKDPTKEVWPTQVMTQLLLDLRSSGAIVTPFEIDDGTKQQKWQIRELTDGGRAETFVTGLSYLDALMLRGLGVPEEIATRGSVGSQAKTTEVREVFLQELEIVKKTLVLRTINEQIVTPLVQFNFGLSSAIPRVTAPEFNREQKELLGEILKILLQTPPNLAPGADLAEADSQSVKRLLNVERLVALLNIPHRKAKEVAKVKADESTDPSDEDGEDEGGRPSSGPPQAPPAAAPKKSARRLYVPESFSRGGRRVDSEPDGDESPSIVVNNYVQQPPAPSVTVQAPPPIVIPAPIVKSTVNVPPQDPPDVVVNVPQQPAPIFNVPPADAPDVVVNTPQVVVTSSTADEIGRAVKAAVQELKPVPKDMKIKRDPNGKGWSATIEPKPEAKE